MTTLLTPWTGKLLRGRLVARKHRFLFEAILDGGTHIEGYCPNPGRMEGLVRKGAEIWVSRSNSKVPKLEWTWELVRIDGQLVGVNSRAPNKLVSMLLNDQLLKPFKKWPSVKSEQKLGADSRIDFALHSKLKRHLVEVKGAHLVHIDGTAYFPDSVAIRSLKHLTALKQAVERGESASVIVTVLRGDAKKLRPSDLHFPKLCGALREAKEAGVGFHGLVFEPTPKGYLFKRQVKLDVRPYATDGLLPWISANREFSGWERPPANPNARWRGSRTRSRVRPRTPRSSPKTP